VVSASDGAVTVASSAVSAAVTLPSGNPAADGSAKLAAPPPGTLAFTGARVSELGWTALMLLIVGLACVTIAKRRPRETL